MQIVDSSIKDSLIRAVRGDDAEAIEVISPDNLINILHGQDKEAAGMAAIALSKKDPEVAIPELKKSLANLSDNDQHCAQVISTLIELAGDDPEVLNLLSEKILSSGVTSQEALKALPNLRGFLQYENAISIVIDLLSQDSDVHLDPENVSLAESVLNKLGYDTENQEYYDWYLETKYIYEESKDLVGREICINEDNGDSYQGHCQEVRLISNMCVSAILLDQDGKELTVRLLPDSEILLVGSKPDDPFHAAINEGRQFIEERAAHLQISNLPDIKEPHIHVNPRRPIDNVNGEANAADRTWRINFHGDTELDSVSSIAAHEFFHAAGHVAYTREKPESENNDPMQAGSLLRAQGGDGVWYLFRSLEETAAMCNEFLLEESKSTKLKRRIMDVTIGQDKEETVLESLKAFYKFKVAIELFGRSPSVSPFGIEERVVGVIYDRHIGEPPIDVYKKYAKLIDQIDSHDHLAQSEVFTDSLEMKICFLVMADPSNEFFESRSIYKFLLASMFDLSYEIYEGVEYPVDAMVDDLTRSSLSGELKPFLKKVHDSLGSDGVKILANVGTGAKDDVATGDIILSLFSQASHYPDEVCKDLRRSLVNASKSERYYQRVSNEESKSIT